jgi:glycosyltransferase involved in cell wall biosynthesis
MHQGVDVVDSVRWAGARPMLTVVIATHRRPHLLAGVLDALVGQDVGPERFEVVLVDDGSGDDTADRLRAAVHSTPLALRVVLLPTSRGPSGARNAGVAAGRSPVVAFTDDDCVPVAGWVGALLAAFDAGADLVQGATGPPPLAAKPGPWARTINVSGPSPLFETCNIAYRRDLFDTLGGFDESDELTALGGGRHFGEDTVLGGRLVDAGGQTAFAPDAVVHHRWEDGDFAAFLRARWRLAGFPGLANRSAHLRSRLVLGTFLSSRTATTDLAVVGVLVGVGTRRAWPLLAAVPWVRGRWGEARSRASSRHPVIRLAQLAVADSVGLVALVVGSVRHRRLVL